MHAVHTFKSLAVFFAMASSLIFGVVSVGGEGPQEPQATEQAHGILDRMERADDQLTDLKAKLLYTTEFLTRENPDDPPERQNYNGSVTYLSEPQPPRFMIHFEEWNDGKYRYDEDLWFLFDGRWLTVAKEKSQTIEQDELVRPGETTELFKLGKGPFPLPFGQAKADILVHFRVVAEPPAPGDPEHTDHLVCTPKADSEMSERYGKVELFISNESSRPAFGLPVVLIVIDKKDDARKTVTLQDIDKNSGLDSGDFKLPSRTRNWTITRRPIEP